MQKVLVTVARLHSAQSGHEDTTGVMNGAGWLLVQ